MNTPRNTDDIVPERVIPTPEQEAQPPRLIDIHIYNLAEEEIKSVESTLQETEETSQPEEWQEQTGPDIQHKRTLSPVLLVLIALFILSLITGGLASFLLLTPTLTVTIIPKSVETEMTGTITVVPGKADGTKDEIEGRILPAITMTEAQTAQTTGRTEQQARPGHGTITFYNAAPYPQTIVAGTLLTGSDGIQVVTDQAVTVPAVSYPTLGAATVSAHAVQPGPNGNIKASDIYGPCCLLNISAVSSAFTGGANAEIYQSVSEPDIDQAAERLRTSLTQAVTAALSSETLVIPLTCQQTVTADHKVGEKATQVQVTLSEACTGVTYETAAFQQLIQHMQTHAASRELMEHYRLAADVHTAIQTATPDSTSGAYQFSVQSSGIWVYQFSPAVLSRLAATIAGKRREQATQVLLQTPGIQQVSMSNASALPTDPRKIHFLFLVQ